MAEQDEFRRSIRKGEQRLANSKSTLARLKLAEFETSQILKLGTPARADRDESTK